MTGFSRYYTPQSLASLLVDNCGEISPNTIVDICAGSWNLLNAAQEQWPTAQLVAVDIDPNSKGSIHQDGRIWADISSRSGNLYDLVVANPPFHHERPSKDILRIINEISSDCQFDGRVYSRIESTMMLFNSLLVAPGGTLGAIVPNSIINSQNQIRLRKYLAKEFHLEKIIYLPDTAFCKSNRLHTSIVILRRSSHKPDTAVLQAYSTSRGYSTKFLYTLSEKSISDGVWTQSTCYLGVDSSTLNRHFNVIRHNISSSMLHKQHTGTLVPVIHSSSISEQRVLSERLMYTQETQRSNFTTCGDIAVVRVGKNCGDFSVINEPESGLLTSDCILLIKPTTSSARQAILHRMQRTTLKDFKHGVAAQYITKADLEAFCLSAIQ